MGLNKKQLVFITCSSAGINQGGFESYAFDLKKNIIQEGINVFLLKADGKKSKNEILVFNFLKNGSRLNSILCKIFPNKNHYYFHLIGYAVGVLSLVLFYRPSVVYSIDLSTFKFIQFFKSKLRLGVTLITFTGGQLSSRLPNGKGCFLHHVTPYYLEKATNDGWKPENQYIIPHFLDEEIIDKTLFPAQKKLLKEKLGIPENIPVILSVGSIYAKNVKRMEYLIEEISELKFPHFLLILGHIFPQGKSVIELAEKMLEKGKFLFHSCPKEEIYQYYEIANLFVLCSLKEGFGLVFIEALSHSIPVIAHDFPVARFVLKDNAYFLDLSKKGSLSSFLEKTIPLAPWEISREERKAFAKDTYSWENLRTNYLQMLQPSQSKLP